jgi:hypothetical protein
MHFLKLFYDLAQVHDLFVFLKEHGHQEGLKRQGVCGIGRSRDMLLGGGEKVIKDELVSTAQGAAEAGQSGFLLVHELGC